MFEHYIRPYNEAIHDTDREAALGVVRGAFDQGVSPQDIIFKLIVPAVGEMIKEINETQGGNLAQHFMASRIALEVTEEMLARIPAKPEYIGLMVIGTACDDMHSLGKRIVTGCLKAMMVDTIDLGVNVPAEKFVDAAVAHNAQVIGISAMMMHTARGEEGCLKVRKILRERGLEDKIKIIVGGAPFRYDPDLAGIVGADGWAEDGISAAKVIIDLIKEVQS